ncbi:C4-dicarboxylate transporter DctM subunit [Neobacillus niacini]|uniref:TRAP transporter large permease n=1 Tax=Neobacillus niacini TaxID=86668 RepID=UPI002781EE3C|nr:TRAP transporter large permease subunit [Neobacillus niacini]MDQ1002653.1 C4-dicarboxylate transporter DctM subunit [Neobacillus niacini]
MITLTSILILLIALFTCLLLGVPIGFSLGLSGLLTILFTVGDQFMIQVPMTLYKSLSEFIFLAIPLYILMGEILYQGKSGERIFWVINSWLHRIRGGTGVATVTAYTFFAAIVGSSMTSVLTIGKIAIPEMGKQNYSKGLTYGLSAIGGSLGILIPPSIPLILYASLTNTSPGKLFIAGIIPGLILASILIIWTSIKAPRKIKVDSDSLVSVSDRIRKTIKALPDLLLPVVVLGGIYLGIYTPTEAAAVGVIYAIVLTVFIHKNLKITELGHVFVESVKTTSMLLSIVVGALVFGAALTLVGLPTYLSETFIALSVSPWVALLIMNIIWIIMGMFLEVVSIILITVPIFFPIAMALGFDPIWFGIIMVLNMELAVITPPVGMNLFAIKSVIPEERLEIIMKSVLPYALFAVLVLAIVWIFPSIVTGIF